MSPIALFCQTFTSYGHLGNIIEIGKSGCHHKDIAFEGYGQTFALQGSLGLEINAKFGFKRGRIIDFDTRIGSYPRIWRHYLCLWESPDSSQGSHTKLTCWMWKSNCLWKWPIRFFNLDRWRESLYQIWISKQIWNYWTNAASHRHLASITNILGRDRYRNNRIKLSLSNLTDTLLDVWAKYFVQIWLFWCVWDCNVHVWRNEIWLSFNLSTRSPPQGIKLNKA